LDTEDIVKASWSLFQHDGAAALKLSERSPLPPALPATNLPRGRTQIFNVCQICNLNRHPDEIDAHSGPESISETDDWLSCNGDLDNAYDTEDDSMADVESCIPPGNGIKNPECPEPQDVSAAPNVPGLIWPTRKYRRQAEKVLVTLNAIETRRNMAVKKKLDRIRKCFTSFFKYLDREFWLEIYYGQMVSSSL